MCVFSHQLSPSEHNYDIGNHELLAVWLALGEWREWLEGATVPFVVWSDHKNFEYIRLAKRLNAQRVGPFSLTISTLLSLKDPVLKTET